MLKRFAAALVATALIAAPALAQNSGTAPGNPSLPGADDAERSGCIGHSGKACCQVDRVNQVGKAQRQARRKHHTKHVRKHSQKTTARMHQTRHMKSGKARAASAAKSGKQS